MGQNCNGLDWFTNVFKKIEDRCLEFCDFLEKEVLKYVEGQPDPVGVEVEHSQEHLDVQDQFPDKVHHNSSSADAFVEVPEEHHVQTDRQTIRPSDQHNHRILEPNHLSVYQELSGSHKIKKESTKANIPKSPGKQGRKLNALTEERVKSTPSTIQNDEFPDWEII